MRSLDLPEPTRRSFSPSEKLARHWNLLVVFLTFVAAYTVLHKLLIPSVLKLTPLKLTPYSQIDWWFIHPVILALVLHKADRNTPLISLLAGIAILYGAYEIFEASQGRHLGWLMFSRLLSAVPLAIGSGYLMAQRRLGGSMRAAWLGALLLGIFISGREFWLYQKTISALGAEPSIVRSSLRGIPAGEYPACGAQELVIKPVSQSAQPSVIKIAPCGFTPPVLTVDRGVLEISNLRAEAANLRLFLYEKGKAQASWNILIPAHSNARHEINLEPGVAGMLISDSAPELGIVAVIPTKLTKPWSFKRKPITIEQSP